MKYLVALVALGAAACADNTTAPSSASGAAAPNAANYAATVTRTTVPFTVQACNGETVAGNSDQHVVLNFVNTPVGRIIASINETDKLDGVGTVTGVSYSGSLKIMNHSIGNALLSDAHGATVLHLISRLRLSGRGVPPTDVDVTTDFVANGQGDPVVQKSEFTSSCQP